jgi:hypothetical protein
VTEGMFGNHTYVVYDNGVQFVNQTLTEAPGAAGLVVIADADPSACGDRCTNIEVFQAGSEEPEGPDSDENSRPRDAYYFRCTNEVYTVLDWGDPLPSDFQFPDQQARILAGAMGWSGEPVNNDTRQYVTYRWSSQVGFARSPNSTDVAALVSEFTTKAIAAMDTIFPGITLKEVQGREPIEAQVLIVMWRWAGTFLAILPVLHFLSLMAVIVWANKAVIKDDSHLAVAQAYMSLLKGLDDTGCMLRGDEIVHKLGYPKVIYGFTDPGKGEEDPGHIDVFTEESGVMPERSFREGTFDGMRKRRRKKVANSDPE